MTMVWEAPGMAAFFSEYSSYEIAFRSSRSSSRETSVMESPEPVASEAEAKMTALPRIMVRQSRNAAIRVNFFSLITLFLLCGFSAAGSGKTDD